MPATAHKDIRLPPDMRSSPKSGQNMDKSEQFFSLYVKRFFTLEHTEWVARFRKSLISWIENYFHEILYKTRIYEQWRELLTIKKSQNNNNAWFSVCLREAESKRPMWLINGGMTQTRSHEPANSQLRCLPAALLWELEHLYDSWNSCATVDNQLWMQRL